MKTTFHGRMVLEFAVGFLVVGTGPVLGQDEPGGPRAIAIEAINPHPGFIVRVDVDRANRVYKGGDELKIKVRAEEAGYLYLFYCDAGDNVYCVFPNKHQVDNKIPAKETIAVPSEKSNFRLRVGAPYGWEVLTAIVTKRPLSLFNKVDVTKRDVTELTTEDFRGVCVEAQKQNGAEWAEHQVRIFTYDAANPSAEAKQLLRGQPRRIALFVGVSEYISKQIRKLTAAHRDATAIAEVFKKHGGLDDAIVLVNEKATREAIEEAIRKTLPEVSRPGDTIFIYWSGHGGRCADSNGGFNEYLVPHDGSLKDLDSVRKTMILDETFGRWMQQLDGRRVVLIFDACYSGGLSRDVKDAKQPFANFLDGFLRRARELGHGDVALLASSSPTQISFERRERDHSVMTYFLIDHLRKANAPIDLTGAFTFLKEHVPQYVERTYPGQTQTPVLIPEDDKTPLRVKAPN